MVGPAAGALERRRPAAPDETSLRGVLTVVTRHGRQDQRPQERSSGDTARADSR